MFGYVVANKDIMTEDQLRRYRGCYCGVCRQLKKRCGSLSRLTLTYDMTFLVLLLSSMYEPEENVGEERCVAHPARAHEYWENEITDYAADMNLALAYLNMLDDWKDDRKVLRLLESGMFSGKYNAVREKYPEKCAFIEDRLKDLNEIEQRGDKDPDAGAKCFGAIMGELFSYKTDSMWGGAVRGFGEALGRFVYIMDAVVDLPKDREKGSYNPMAALAEQGKTEDELRYILTMLIGECAARFERLPLVRDADIMRNILYSGVWLRYNAAAGRGTKEETKEEGEERDG